MTLHNVVSLYNSAQLMTNVIKYMRWDANLPRKLNCFKQIIQCKTSAETIVKDGYIMNKSITLFMILGTRFGTGMCVVSKHRCCKLCELPLKVFNQPCSAQMLNSTSHLSD